jgi:siderophore ferric iron reductase
MPFDATAAGEGSALGQLLQQLAQALPGLDGRIDEAAADEFSLAAASPAIGQLLQHLRTRHPEAGPHYWGCRSWGLLLWQPAYATVLGVELAAALPDWTAMQQRLLPGMVAGFSLPAQPLRHETAASLRQPAATQLSAIAATVLPQLAAQQPLHAKLAGRLLADCVVAALLLLQRLQPARDNAAIEQLTAQWLAALDLPQASGVWPVALEQGGERLALARRACCQHFRRCDGSLCSTCPKLQTAARVALLRKEWAQYADPA